MTAAREDEQDVDHFHRWSDRYEASHAQRYLTLIHDEVLRMVWSDASPPDSILDIGCGTGRLLRKAASRWPHARLVGIDPAEGMITVARRLAQSTTFQEARAESIPLPDDSVDLVLTAVSFHHWKDQLQGLREVFRVLRPGGHFCLADIALPRWIARLLHSNAKDSKEIRRLVSEAALDVVGQRTILAHVISVTDAGKPRGAYALPSVRVERRYQANDFARPSAKRRFPFSRSTLLSTAD